jgi:OOP family OmpA-OmpF porin
MTFRVSIIASSILVIALNAAEAPSGWGAPPSVEQSSTVSGAVNTAKSTPAIATTPVPEITTAEEQKAIEDAKLAAIQNAITRKAEHAAAQKVKDAEIEKAEKVAAAKNAAEVEAAKRGLGVIPENWDLNNTTSGTANKIDTTEHYGFSKVVNKSEFSHIVPIAVEEAPVELDHDHDGVPNTIDKCPTTPLGEAVNAVGCPLDDDHDGVPNAIDKCPNTPEGRKVDADGCESDKICVYDSDEDGVIDPKDECPNTPKLFKVNGVGCPLTAILKVNFDTDKYNIKDRYTEDITKFAQFLKDNEGYNAIISGHTDAIASDAYNLVLSQNRANTVMKALINDGVAAGRLTAIGEGESRPIADNLYKDGRAENRRIEVELKQLVTNKK